MADENSTIIHWSHRVYSADIKSYCCNTHPPTESGTYISWFSSTFSAVSFFSVPEERGREREKQGIGEMHATAQGSYWLSLLVAPHRVISIRRLIGLIHTIVNTVISSVVINPDFYSAVLLDSSDFCSLVLTHEHYGFPKRMKGSK